MDEYANVSGVHRVMVRAVQEACRLARRVGNDRSSKERHRQLCERIPSAAPLRARLPDTRRGGPHLADTQQPSDLKPTTNQGSTSGPLLVAFAFIWLPGETRDTIFGNDFAAHRFHAVGLSAAGWLLVGATLTQLRRPSAKLGGLLFALAMMVLFIPIDLVSGVFSPLELVVLALLAGMYLTRPDQSLEWRPIRQGSVALAAVGVLIWTPFA